MNTYDEQRMDIRNEMKDELPVMAKKKYNLNTYYANSNDNFELQ